MKPARGRWFAISAFAAITGGGIGYQAGEIGLTLAPGVGIWIALLGMGTLLGMFLTTPMVSGVPAAAIEEAGWTEFRREFRRARRGGRQLTLLRIAGEDLAAMGTARAGDLIARARRLGLNLRLVDRIWVDEGSIYVLLPESPRSSAHVLIGRIRAASPGELPDHIRIATFPEDGLTSGAIIAAVNDGALDAVPIPIRQTLAEPVDVEEVVGALEVGEVREAAAYAMDDQLAVGEAVRT